MGYVYTYNTKQKELNEYLRSEESVEDFKRCLADGTNWNLFLKEKGLIKLEVYK